MRRACSKCGFDNAEIGKPCPLCNGAETLFTAVQEEAGTIALGTFDQLVEPPSNHPAGHIYADRFEILSFLGRGGMGTVYRVFDRNEKREMALKILHGSIARETDGIHRFQREAQILAKIRHPSVPQIFHFGSHSGDFYYAGEWIEGRDLKTEMADKRVWDAIEAADLIASVADALHGAHSQGIVHRDVKPSNIMLGKDGAVYLLDFGIARGIGQDMSTITRTGIVVGTPEYMSPEHFEPRTIDARSDLYSLAVVLYEMLSGQLPFVGQTPIVVAMKHRTEMPVPPRTLRGTQIPSWLNRIVMRGLEKDPAKRFESMAEFALQLRKSRNRQGHLQKLGTGDWVTEDPQEPWTLEIEATSEKDGWENNMALQYENQHFKLAEIVKPGEKDTKRWKYLFVFWPPNEAFRKIVDYESDCLERKSVDDAKFSSKIKKLIG